LFRNTTSNCQLDGYGADPSAVPMKDRFGFAIGTRAISMLTWKSKF
jgi:hypothetical protein